MVDRIAWKLIPSERENDKNKGSICNNLFHNHLAQYGARLSTT
jgi:hypothetical protein